MKKYAFLLLPMLLNACGLSPSDYQMMASALSGSSSSMVDTLHYNTRATNDLNRQMMMNSYMNNNSWQQSVGGSNNGIYWNNVQPQHYDVPIITIP